MGDEKIIFPKINYQTKTRPICISVWAEVWGINLPSVKQAQTNLRKYAANIKIPQPNKVMFNDEKQDNIGELVFVTHWMMRPSLLSGKQKMSILL